MKLPRERLAEIADGKKASKAEVIVMARELLSIRDEETKRDERHGDAIPVLLEYIGASKGAAFAPQRVRMLRSNLHVGARFSWGGRMYGVVSIDGDHVRVR